MHYGWTWYNDIGASPDHCTVHSWIANKWWAGLGSIPAHQYSQSNVLLMLYIASLADRAIHKQGKYQLIMVLYVRFFISCIPIFFRGDHVRQDTKVRTWASQQWTIKSTNVSSQDGLLYNRPSTGAPANIQRTKP